MLVLQGYLFLTVAIGFILTTRSDAFGKLSFWKQFVVLSISPLLVVREIFKDLKKEL